MTRITACFVLKIRHLYLPHAYAPIRHVPAWKRIAVKSVNISETLNNRLGQGIGDDDDDSNNYHGLHLPAMEAYRGQICPILMESFTETAANCTNAIGFMPETTDRFTILVQVGRRMNSINR